MLPLAGLFSASPMILVSIYPCLTSQSSSCPGGSAFLHLHRTASWKPSRVSSLRLSLYSQDSAWLYSILCTRHLSGPWLASCSLSSPLPPWAISHFWPQPFIFSILCPHTGLLNVFQVGVVPPPGTVLTGIVVLPLDF